ncbi:MAG: hypothetical protein ACSHYA_20065 [Opitutaceae bacterium]
MNKLGILFLLIAAIGCATKENSHSSLSLSEPEIEHLIAAWRSEYGYYPTAENNAQLVRILSGREWLDGAPEPHSNSIRMVTIIEIPDELENPQFLDKNDQPYVLKVTTTGLKINKAKSNQSR